MPFRSHLKDEPCAICRHLARCAREDSNLHGPYGPQGLQPCASTSSATGAWERQHSGPFARSRGARQCGDRASSEILEAAPLSPSGVPAKVRTSVRLRTSSPALGALSMDLTKRQQEIFDFIKRYSAKYGYPPTVRDIGKAVGLASSSTVHAHLANLEKLGLLRRDPSKPRAIELLDRAVEGVKSVVRPSGLPLVGQVAAGSPVLAEE